MTLTSHPARVPCLQERGSKSVIPTHQRAKVAYDCDAWLHRERHLTECCINKLTHIRRIFSPFDKLDRSYLGFVHVVCALIWLQSNGKRTLSIW